VLAGLRWVELFMPADAHSPNGEQDAFSLRTKAYRRDGVL